MGLIARDPSTSYPPGYAAFKERGIPFEMLRFKGGVPRLHRFAHRYRFAKEFQWARFTTYSPSTAAAYSALCKYHFTYAAFEALRRALGIEREDLGEYDLSKYPVGEWDTALRAIPTHSKLFSFVSWYAKKTLRAQCRAFIAGKPYKFLLLAAAMRHSFAHGDLTASSNDTEPDDTRRICVVLGDALVTIMDAEFGGRTVPILARLRNTVG